MNDILPLPSATFPDDDDRESDDAQSASGSGSGSGSGESDSASNVGDDSHRPSLAGSAAATSRAGSPSPTEGAATSRETKLGSGVQIENK